MRATRLRDLRGLIVPAVADGHVLTTLVTHVSQAFADSPSLNRLFGIVTVAKVTPHVTATGTALRRANVSGLLHPAAAAARGQDDTHDLAEDLPTQSPPRTCLVPG